MKRTIYHGSSRIVRVPKFGSGSAGSDYGLGFYCTDNARIAGDWAASRHADGFINRYTIETDGLRIINLNSPEYCILHWLSVLLSFREFDADSSSVYQAKEYIRSAFSVDYQNCDAMIGFRADDCNFWFAQSFLNGEISYRQFNEAVRMSNTGRQFVIKSNRAFDRMLFYGYEISRSEYSLPAASARQRAAMQNYARIAGVQGSSAGGLYAEQIVSERIQPYDRRLMY